MSTRPQELNKIIADLRQIIVGKVAMPTDQIEQITLFLFLKQLSKKHDELVRIGSKELIFTGEWERYHFDVLIRHSGEDLVKECREAVESLYKNPHIDPTVRKVFERSYLKILEPKVLSSFLIYLNDKFSDGLDLGDFYESLLPILGTQNELGQFRTPRHIIDFIVRVVDPSIGEKIADPACGTAGFLVSAFNYLKEKYTEKGRLNLNPEQIKQLYNDTIYGWDMEPLMVKFSLANLYLHGLKVPNVSENDTLLNENLWQHTFDVIVANPPFITPKGGARRHSRFAIKSNKTEVLFCEWIVNHLNYNGRMGIIIPEGIIFDASSGHKSVRKLFLDNGLWCVVSLPPAVFQPYSGVKTSIIFLDKTLKPENILFYKVINHGFSLNTNPIPIDKNDLPEALEVLTKYKKGLQNNIQEVIQANNYVTVEKIRILEDSTNNLSSGPYQVKNILINHHYPIVKLGQICSIKTGKKDVNQGNPKGIFPFFTCAKENTFSDTYSFDTEALLVAGNGDVGNITYFKGKFEAYQRTYVLSDFKNVNARYLYYCLNYDFKETVVKQKLGNTMPYIKMGMLSDYRLPLPPLDIQKHIVSELENYQQIIDGAKQIVENWKPSFEIDPKWKTDKLGEICDVFGGGTPSRSEASFWGGNIPWISSKYFTDEHTIDGYEGITDQGLKNSSSKLAPKGSTILITRVSVGRFAIADRDYAINQDLTALVVKDAKKVSNKYLWLISVIVAENIKNNAKGVGVVGVTRDFVTEQEIPLPPIEIQNQIVEKVEEEKKIIEANKRLIDLFQKKIDARIKSIWES